MDTQQSLDTIKTVINAAIQKGVFLDMEGVANVLMAFQVISSAVKPELNGKETANDTPK